MKKILSTLLIFILSSCGMNVISGKQEENFDTQSQVENNLNEDTGYNEAVEQRDTGSADTDANIEDDQSEQEILIDYGQPGIYSVTISTSTASVTNCASMSYDIYTPEVIENNTVIVLGHGFARGSDVMAGWAEHISSWGIKVLLPTLCHYNILFGVDHEMNGQNMKELAEIHGATSTVYAGHSAGGLAALIATSQDNNAIGVLGLDTTDTQDIPGVDDFIGRDYAPRIESKSFSIFGESSSCNGSNNGIILFQMISGARIIKIKDADHCDFENPTDSICEMSCETSSAVFTDDQIRLVIKTLGTSALMGMINNEDVWSSDYLEELILEGLVSEI